MSEPHTGVVLAGAAALGAYEAGVLDHLFTEVARDVGHAHLFEVVSGTSAGAINAAALGAFADQPQPGVSRLCATWAGLRLSHLLRPSAVELVWLVLDMGGAPGRLGRALRIRAARGGLLDPGPLMTLLEDRLPIARIPANLRAGHLRGIALAATHVASGRAAVFYDIAGPALRWAGDASMTPVPARLGIAHAMASAAIPLLFPPVTIDSDLYCDGGLRQLVPLSPSLQLGARRLLVVNPLARAAYQDQRPVGRDAVTSPLYLGGKVLNALFADRTEVDLARLDQLNGVLRAGRRRYGPTFDADLNAELHQAGHAPLNEITALWISPSRDLGLLATEYAMSSDFGRRERGVVGRVLRCLAEQGATRAGDFLSYLLFDGGFASELIALGRADARARHAELCGFFAAAPAPMKSAAQG